MAGQLDSNNPDHLEGALDALVEEFRPTGGVIIIVFDGGMASHAAALKASCVDGKLLLATIKAELTKKHEMVVTKNTQEPS